MRNLETVIITPETDITESLITFPIGTPNSKKEWVMTKLKHTRHVLAVHNLKRSTEFYRDLLGFTLDWGDENWSFMHRDNYSIMLGECKDAIDPGNLGDHSYYAYIETENIDGFYKDLVEKEVEVTSELSEKPWGMKEFGIRTVDGHRVMFGETVESTG